MSSNMEKEVVEEHFDEVAKRYDYWKKKNAYYYENVISHVKRIIPEGSSVLDVGCGTGEVLSAVKPKKGVGIDLSSEMVKLAEKKFPEYSFYHKAIEELDIGEKFDYIIMVDVVDHVYDVMDVFKRLHKFCHPQTQVILTTINPWWDPILMFMEKFGAKMP